MSRGATTSFLDVLEFENVWLGWHCAAGSADDDLGGVGSNLDAFLHTHIHTHNTHSRRQQVAQTQELFPRSRYVRSTHARPTRTQKHEPINQTHPERYHAEEEATAPQL